MPYLLSTGLVTDDHIIYIKDIILLNMKLLKNEIPYFEGGSDELIEDIETSNLEGHLRTIVNSIINRVTLKFPDTSVLLEDIKVTNNSINVIINIENNLELYEIKRSD